MKKKKSIFNQLDSKWNIVHEFMFDKLSFIINLENTHVCTCLFLFLLLRWNVRKSIKEFRNWLIHWWGWLRFGSWFCCRLMYLNLTYDRESSIRLNCEKIQFRTRQYNEKFGYLCSRFDSYLENTINKIFDICDDCSFFISE